MATVQFHPQLAQLTRAAAQFGWVPSEKFRGRLVRFAHSVGSGNVDDLFALASFVAWERYRKHPAEVSEATDSFETAILRELDRERQQWRRLAERSNVGLEFVQPTGADDAPGRRIESQETLERVWRVIRQVLSVQDQKLLEYHLGLVWSYEEIATLTGMSNDALRQRLSRAKKLLREALADPTDQYG